MTVNVKELVEYALIDLTMDYPIFAQLIMRIGVRVVNDPLHRYLAWTDGRSISINEPLVIESCADPIITRKDTGEVINRNVGKKEMVFILCHELMHLLNQTFARGERYGLNKYDVSDKSQHMFKLWNMATDYEINACLYHNTMTHENGATESKPIGKKPETVLYEAKWANSTAEEIMDELMKQNEEQMLSTQFKFISQSGEEGEMGFDEHLPIADDATQSEINNKIAEVFGSRQNGTGMSAIDRALQIAFKEKPFNWRRALTKYIRSWMRDNYTWNKPSRAGIANNVILPSAGKTPKLHLGVAIDTSGSISDVELNEMMQHLFTILQQFKAFTVDVWCCGSEVYPKTFRTYTAANKKEIVNFRFESDGGNDMRKNFEFLTKRYKGELPDILLICSDFYDPLDGDTETTSPVPVVGLVLDHPDFVPPTKMKFTAIPFTLENGK